MYVCIYIYICGRDLLGLFRSYVHMSTRVLSCRKKLAELHGLAGPHWKIYSPAACAYWDNGWREGHISIDTCPEGSSGKAPSAVVLQWNHLAFLRLCFSIVARLEELSHKEVRQGSLNYDLGQGSLGYGLTFGLPLHVFVVCCWGGKVFPLRAWSKISLILISLLWMSFTISSCCNLKERFLVVCCCWGGRVVVLCTCLLLPKCKVWLRLFSEGWAPCPPPPFTSLTSPAWRLFIYLFMGRKRVLFSQSRRQVSSENRVFPLCTLCFLSYFIIFYVAFLFLCSYRDERVVSWPVVLHLFIYLLLMGKQWALKGRLDKVFLSYGLPWKHV